MKKVLLSMLVMLAGTSAWAQTFTSDGKTLTITVTDEANPQKVAEAMNGKSYSKVIVNGGGTISEEFVHGILFTQYAANSSILSLDLSQVSLEGNRIKPTFFTPADKSWRGGQLNIASLALPQVETIDDNAFYANTKLTQVVLPSTLKTIGKLAFASTKLTEVTLPENLDKVDDAAFWEVRSLTYVRLNNKLRFIGAGAFGLNGELTDKSQKTIKIPSSIKYIGPKAFAERNYEDVYFLGKDAPLCPQGEIKVKLDQWGNILPLTGSAFSGTSDRVYYGNNGFTSEKNGIADDATTGFANRENYKNQGVYFTVMHYPNDLTEEQLNKYTDSTRKYETISEENLQKLNNCFPYGKSDNPASYFVVGNQKLTYGFKDTYVGGQYIWPSQEQWKRAFDMAENGLVWDGSKVFAPTLSSDEISILAEAGWNVADADLAKKAYMGTRKFVIANGDVKGQTPDFPISVKGGRWWTLCVPFNMTKKMVDEAMGEGTQVCRFSSVKRLFNEDDDYNHITLLFRNDVYKHKTEKVNGVYEAFNPDGAAPSDDDIVIYAHEAYMVYPTKTSQDPASYVVKDYEPVEGSPIPTYILADTKTKVNGMEHQAEGNPCEYRFVGNYLDKTSRSKVVLPANVYFYGRQSAAEKNGQFWFHNGSYDVAWGANKCVVETSDAEVGAEDADYFFSVAGGVANKAKQSSVFGEDSSDNNTTGVEKVTIIACEDADSAVYALNGQIVNRNGETNNLPKGVYVKNGKKFIVK